MTPSQPKSQRPRAQRPGTLRAPTQSLRPTQHHSSVPRPQAQAKSPIAATMPLPATIAIAFVIGAIAAAALAQLIPNQARRKKDDL